MKKMILTVCASFVLVSGISFSGIATVTPKASATVITIIAELERLEAIKIIPNSLKDSDDKVILDKFSESVKGKVAYKEPKTGWTIEKDTAGHGGRKWKLKNKSGDRVASLDENGKVLSK
ncbi:hypothetical protein ABEW34_16390 [Paenibacillus algorifonticola]|uniref:hypothetical protein n=1 Tax=Paenibacillus algorifonticola TaxID=684063 RepID=UPI003D2E4F03